MTCERHLSQSKNMSHDVEIMTSKSCHDDGQVLSSSILSFGKLGVSGDSALVPNPGRGLKATSTETKRVVLQPKSLTILDPDLSNFCYSCFLFQKSSNS